MKRLIIAAVACCAALATGCAPPQALYISNATPLDNTCNASSSTSSTAALVEGLLDLALAGPAPVYIAKFHVGIALSGQLQVGSSTLSNQAQQDVVVNQYILNYTPPLGVSSESLPMYYVVKAGSTESDNLVPVNLFGPKASAAVAGLVAAGAPQQTVLVSVQLRGNLSNNQGAAGSNEITFPVVVYHSNAAPCPSPAPPCAAQDGLGCAVAGP